MVISMVLISTSFNNRKQVFLMEVSSPPTEVSSLLPTEVSSLPLMEVKQVVLVVPVLADLVPAVSSLVRHSGWQVPMRRI